MLKWNVLEQNEQYLSLFNGFLSNKYTHLAKIPQSSSYFYISIILGISSILIIDYFSREKKGPSIIQKIMNTFSEAMSLPNMLFQNSSRNDRFASIKSSPQYKKLYKKAIKNGGFPGGLANDGNTCFMNSVIQCLASSEELNQFLTSFASSNNSDNNSDDNDSDANDHADHHNESGPCEAEDSSSSQASDKESSKRNKINSLLKTFKSKTNNKKNNRLLHVPFSVALLSLLDELNSKHGKYAPTFSTRHILHVMKDSPNRHLFLGYNQEDAQEFYQNLMKQVEKEFTDSQKLENITIETGSDEKDEMSDNKEKVSTITTTKYQDLQFDSITGLKELGHLGDVLVPVSNIDPADSENKDKYSPFRLITPVDGLQCDRIGCVSCGEMGGIRYSVTSGLALNIPMEGANRNRFTLGELISEFCKPEIIDGVECSRCNLVTVKEKLIERLENLKDNETNLSGSKLLITKIVERIQQIDDALSRNCIHDDVYKKLHTKNMVQKGRKVKQSYLSRPPPLLCIHINRSVFDPRTYMVRKNNAKIDFPLSLDLSDFVASDDDINLDARLEFRKQDEDATKLDRGNTLRYTLKSVISHFGTHNYGHYIAFRKIRGNWWHISDETVRLSSEEEVLASQGTFMLFYETFRDSDIEEEEEEEEKEEGNEEGEDSDISKNSRQNSDLSYSDTSDSSLTDSELNKDEDNCSTSLKSIVANESQDHLINIQANL